MRSLKMFISGMAFPSFIIPFLLLLAWQTGRSQLLTNPLVHFIPLIWGIWNILYFAFFSKILPGNSRSKLMFTGGILGLLITILGVFWLNIPAQIGLPKSLTYLPLILGPIAYAIFWSLLVGPLNKLLQVEKD